MGGDSPSLSPTRSQPLLPLSFVFLHFSEEQGEARALKAAFVRHGATRVSPRDHYATAGPLYHRAPSGSRLDIIAPDLPTRGAAGAPRTPGTPRAGKGGDTTLCPSHLPFPFLTPSNRNRSAAGSCFPQGKRRAEQGLSPTPAPGNPPSQESGGRRRGKSERCRTCCR